MANKEFVLEAIDAAYKEHVAKLFAVLVDGMLDSADGGATATLGRFRKGLERANEAREKARTIAEGLAEGQ